MVDQAHPAHGPKEPYTTSPNRSHRPVGQVRMWLPPQRHVAATQRHASATSDRDGPTTPDGGGPPDPNSAGDADHTSLPGLAQEPRGGKPRPAKALTSPGVSRDRSDGSPEPWSRRREAERRNLARI